jgi:hypothetical protein
MKENAMRRTRYFNRDGDEVSAREALHGSTLRDGFSIRVPTLFRDAARQQFGDARAFWDRNRASLLVTDVRRIGGTEGNRPGFRVLDNDLGRSAKDAALRQYERFLNDAYKSASPRDAEVEEEDDDGGRKECPQCEGSGFDANGERCRRCQGSGEIPDDGDDEAEAVSDAKRRRRPPDDDDDDDDRPPFGSQDRRSVDQIAANHRRNMARVYDSYARELSEAWKGGNK